MIHNDNFSNNVFTINLHSQLKAKKLRFASYIPFALKSNYTEHSPMDENAELAFIEPRWQWSII